MSIVLTAVFAAVVALGAPESATDRGKDAVAVQTVSARAPGRPLLICQRDEASRRAMKRRYGSAEFVSAKRVLASLGEPAWATPRCITPAEYNRLERLAGPLNRSQ